MFNQQDENQILNRKNRKRVFDFKSGDNIDFRNKKRTIIYITDDLFGTTTVNSRGYAIKESFQIKEYEYDIKRPRKA